MVHGNIIHSFGILTDASVHLKTKWSKSIRHKKILCYFTNIAKSFGTTFKIELKNYPRLSDSKDPRELILQDFAVLVQIPLTVLTLLFYICFS